jgi:hypothetical protein
MALGPGKYDDICTRAREEAQALACVVMVLGGKHGSGFSVTAIDGVQRRVINDLPRLMRFMADSIERDLAREES